MIYLSKLTLNPRSRQVQAELRDLYQMHRTLSRAFGDAPQTFKESRCLFRVEETPDSRVVPVLVQSLIQPDWAYLSGLANYLVQPVQVKTFSPLLKAGQELQFRLHANPTVKRDGKRRGLYKEAEHLAWIRRKGLENGFECLSVWVYPSQKNRASTQRDQQATFCSVLFQGTLRVTDPERLHQALRNGVGAGKGFGFGLLSLARR